VASVFLWSPQEEEACACQIDKVNDEVLETGKMPVQLSRPAALADNWTPRFAASLFPDQRFPAVVRLREEAVILDLPLIFLRAGFRRIDILVDLARLALLLPVLVRERLVVGFCAAARPTIVPAMPPTTAPTGPATKAPTTAPVAPPATFLSIRISEARFEARAVDLDLVVIRLTPIQLGSPPLDGVNPV